MMANKWICSNKGHNSNRMSLERYRNIEITIRELLEKQCNTKQNWKTYKTIEVKGNTIKTTQNPIKLNY